MKLINHWIVLWEIKWLMLSLLLCNNKMKTRNYKQIVLKPYTWYLIRLFPTETTQTYFIPYQREGDKKTPNRGKLWDKYCNLRKIIREISNKNKFSKALPDSSDSIHSINYEGTYLIYYMTVIVLLFCF